MEKKESSETASSSSNTANSSLAPTHRVPPSLPNANPTPNMGNAIHQQTVNQARPTSSNAVDAQRRTGQHLLTTGMPKLPASQNQRLPPQMNVNLHYPHQQRQHLPQHFQAVQHMQTFSAQQLNGIQNVNAARQNTGNDRVSVDKTHKPLSATNLTPAHRAAEEAMRRIRALPPGHTSRLGGKLTYQPRPAHMAPPHPNVPPNLQIPNNNNNNANQTQQANNAVAAAAARANLVNNPMATMAQTGATNPAMVRQASANMMHKKPTPSKGTGSPKKSTSTSPATATAKPPPPTLANTTGASSSVAASASAPTTATTSSTAAAIPMQIPSNPAIAAAAAAAQQPPVLDEATVIDEAIRYAREPLTDKYSPYIIPSDKTLSEARNRLKKAIEQTRQLRAAFSERVYGKYRVCLRPPPTTEQILARIHANPAATHQQLMEEISQLKAEKEIEKKEAQKLNAEMIAANEQSEDGKSTTLAAVNAETAEQLMFISAGLSLIILPEQDVAGTIDMSGYPDRAPVNPETGQRVRSISVAAAAAGEVMLDRARKGATMRAERQRRRQLQIMAGEDPEKESPENSYSRLSLLTSANSSTTPIVPATSVGAANKALLASKMAAAKSSSGTTTAPTSATPSTTPTPTATPSSTSLPSTFHHHHSLTPQSLKSKIGSAALQNKPKSSMAPIISAKAIRARVQATMSNNTLLSLNPSAEELRSDGKQGAATMAMMELGVNPKLTAQQLQQQRFRHPFPNNSVGGRRRAFLGTPQGASVDYALPPIATPKERRSVRPKPVKDPSEARSERAKEAIQGVLQQYVVSGKRKEEDSFPPRKRSKTDISFLYGLEYPAAASESTAADDAKKKEPTIDPMLTFNVLRAVGLIQPSTSDDTGTGGASSPLSIIDQSLLEFAEKRAMDSSPTRKSLAKFKRLTQKLAMVEQGDGEYQSHTVLCSFFPKEENDTKDSEEAKETGDDENDEAGETGMEAESDDKQKGDEDNSAADGSGTSLVASAVPAVAIRGGGSELIDAAEEDEGNNANHDNDAEASEEAPPTVAIRGGGSEAPAAAAEAIHENAENAASETSASNAPPTVAIRGGGSEVTAATEAKPAAVAGAMNGMNNAEAMVAEKVNPQNPRPMNMPPQSASAMQANEMATQQQRIAIMNQQLVRADQSYRMGNAGHPNTMAPNGKAGNNGNRNNRMQGLPADGFNRTGAAAMQAQMAHQFRHASASMQRLPGHPTGELEAYIGNLHAQQGAAAGYEWSQIAALGLNTHRAMVNFSAQDRARAIIAEQQNAAAAAAAQVAAAQRQQAVALMGGAFVPGGAQHFAQFPGHNPALMNNAAMMGHSGMPGVNQPAQMQAPNARTRKRSDSDSTSSQRERKLSNADESGRKRKLSTASSESGNSDKRAKTSSKRSDSNGTSKVPNGVQEGQKRTGKPKTAGQKKSTAGGFSHTLGTAKPAESNQGSNGSEIAKLNKPPQATGMQFYVPTAPAGIPSDMASLVLAAKVHCVIDAWENGEAVFDAATIIDFLLAVGIAVPIPKALVVTPLKERIGSTATKNNPFANVPASSREVIVALILLWLWRYHEECFQKAFAKSGRIDVDPECKWLINAAVDKSVSALGKEIASTGSALSSALSAAKSKGGSSQKGGATQANDSDRSQGRATRVDLLCASIVSRSLLEGTAIDDTMDKMLPSFHDMIEYLDECRMGALHSKARERALLAALISRKATMSLPFSHAYASSMVRAGEAIGHGELFEIVQNEEVKVSTMIPYDVFTDESGAWEDPCRPEGSFTRGLTGDDLMRRAHARAMIHKSLKKLQDRHGIKGGTPNSGAYTDPPTANANPDASKSPTNSGSSSTRGPKRRGSFSEPKFPPGTGSAPATSMNLYEPQHRSTPLEWDCNAPENLPYGKFSSTKTGSYGGKRKSSLGSDSGNKSPKGGNIVVKSGGDELDYNDNDLVTGFARSTHEISWADIADVFESQNVEVSVKKKKKKDAHGEEHSISKNKTIYAPFVRQRETIPDIYSDSDSESDTEEDISDEMVLKRHQEVLDEMKEKLSDFLEARKKSVERKKKRDSLKKAPSS